MQFDSAHSMEAISLSKNRLSIAVHSVGACQLRHAFIQYTLEVRVDVVRLVWLIRGLRNVKLDLKTSNKLIW